MSASHSDGVAAQPAPADAPTPAVVSNEIKYLPAEYYSRYLSDASKRRLKSPIRGLFPLENIPGMISLLAGKPNPGTFPFTSMSFTARNPNAPEGEETTHNMSPQALAASLQYGPTAGYPPLVEWLTGLQEWEHGRKRSEGWRVNVGVGSQDLIYKAITELCNLGDPVLVESPVYAGVIPMFKQLGCQCIEIETDAEGISSSSLRKILELWPSDKPKPKLLYTVPYGCNPTGMTAALHRRKEVLQLAEDHDLLIMEDDPYYYLYYGEGARSPSYFTLERELLPVVGRVLRFDSLSKILSAGIRVGFATGPTALIDAIDANTATSNLQSPGLVNAIVHSLVENWGYEGFKIHAERVSAFYKVQRDYFVKSLEKHLSGLAEWTAPEAGMFVWFKLLIDGDDSEALVRTKALENGVLALPGTVFLPDGRKTAYVRASFSVIGEAEIDEACRRLGETLRVAKGM